MTRPGRAFYDHAVRVLHVYDDRALLRHAGHGRWLNVAQLLNPIFFERDVRHLDMKRQRGRRLRDRALRAARELKAADPGFVAALTRADMEEWKRGRYDWMRPW